MKAFEAKNRQARFDYHIEDECEAGLVLEGWEVKAILAGQANFASGGAFIRLRGGEAWLEAMHVTPLKGTQHGLLQEYNPVRSRKLLLKRTELAKLTRRVAERGYTIVPLALVQRRTLKLVIGLAKGKKQHDKRETVKQRDLAREEARDIAAR